LFSIKPLAMPFIIISAVYMAKKIYLEQGVRLVGREVHGRSYDLRSN
jgi:hypothetical protein